MKKTLFTVMSGLLLSSAAFAEVVVVGNPTAPALTKEQVSDLFLGKTSGMKLVDQPDSSKIKAEFYSKLGHDLSQVKATWSRLIFTGKAPAPKEVPDSAAVKKAVAADPTAIGYIDKADVDGSVKVLSSL